MVNGTRSAHESLLERIRAEYTIATSPTLHAQRVTAEAQMPLEERSQLVDSRTRDVVTFLRSVGYPSAMELWQDAASRRVSLSFEDIVKLAANIQRLRELRAEE